MDKSQFVLNKDQVALQLDHQRLTAFMCHPCDMDAPALRDMPQQIIDRLRFSWTALFQSGDAHRRMKKPANALASRAFYLVAGIGFEPMTFRL